MRVETARYKSSIRGTETVWQCAVGVVTVRGRVGVVGGVTPSLVTAVVTVRVTVTEQRGRQTRPDKSLKIFLVKNTGLQPKNGHR